MKSLFVDLDRQTADLMKEVNTDLTGEIRSCIDIYSKKVNDMLTNLNDNIANHLAPLQQNTQALKSDTERKLRNLENSLEEIMDILNDLQHLQDLSQTAAVLNKTAQDFTAISKRQDENHDEVLSVLDAQTKKFIDLLSQAESNLESRFDVAVKSLYSKIDDLENDAEKHKNAILDKILDSTTQLQNSSINISNAVTSSERSILSTLSSQLSASCESIQGQITSLDNKLNQSLKEIESKISSFEKVLMSEINAKMDIISTKFEQASSKLDMVISKQDENIGHAKANASLLEKIIYLCTPFWKRKKNE